MLSQQHELGMLILKKAQEQQAQADAAKIRMLQAIPGILNGFKGMGANVPIEEPAPDFERVGDVTSDNVTSYPVTTGGLDINRIMQAIGKFESGGNYSSRGAQTKSGDRAYGKYQIMGANIPAWSKEATGNSVDINSFIANPALQDAIAKYRMQQYLNKYGTVGDVASMWFSGRPMRNNYSRDVLGTSVPQYVRAVNQLY